MKLIRKKKNAKKRLIRKRLDPDFSYKKIEVKQTERKKSGKKSIAATGIGEELYIISLLQQHLNKNIIFFREINISTFKFYCDIFMFFIYSTIIDYLTM